MPPDVPNLGELAMAVPGCVHTPGAPAYLDGVRLWNGAATARPAAVARPHSTDEVQTIMRFAHRHGIAVTVRSGGHDWAGRALNDGGLVIDLSKMRQVFIDPSVREAVIHGGATAHDVVRAAEPYGMTVATGTVGDVGFIGFTLGGGYGPLNGIAALGADNLIEAQLVLADGRLVTTDADNEPDLFWALRGGGGNFGVVTQIRVRLHPVAAVAAGVLMFPWKQAADVLRGFDALRPSMPDALTVHSGVISGPDGLPVVFLAPTWVGETDEAPFEELRGLGSPVVEQLTQMPRSAQLHLLDDLVPAGRHYEVRTVNVTALSSDVIDALVHACSTRTSPFSAVSIHHFHGASTRVGVSDTAFGIRAPHLMVEIIAAWEAARADTGTDTETHAVWHRHWAHSLYEELCAHGLPGGYPNLIGPDQRRQAERAYGPNTQRLLAVKSRWDAANVFAAVPLPSPVPSS
jgi:hypothetical protein